jgi:hypothetical protein
MLTGCLVTERVELEDKNLPPSFIDIADSPTPIGALIEVKMANSTKTGPIEVKFKLQVRDENIEQELKIRYQLSTRDPETFNVVPDKPVAGPAVANSGDPIRQLELPITISPPPEGRCYRLDLLASSEFENKPDTWEVPALDGDLARAKWLILFKPETVQSSDIYKTCPSKEYKPVEYTGTDGSAK